MPWLMKAEPDSRVVKGKDVKFSVDDLAEMGESPWDGVRNHQAKNYMRDGMKLGDKVLFYHSNCKMPGVFGIAEISKEGYPDYTAWDPDHPYHDPKSDEKNPTWYMVSVKFVSRLKNPVTLAFVKSLVGATSPPEGVSYIGQEGLEALQSMALVNRGRLSVQHVEQKAFDTIVELGEKGGFEAEVKKPKRAKKVKDEEDDEDDEEAVPKKQPAARKSKTTPRKKRAKKEETSDESLTEDEDDDEADEKPVKKPASKKAKAEPLPPSEGTRRSSRLKG